MKKKGRKMREKNCVKLTEEFLKRKFNESEYFADKKSEKDYRFEHSVRVANIGKEIAEKLPHAEYQELPGGHLLTMEFGEEYLSRVRSFLEA